MRTWTPAPAFFLMIEFAAGFPSGRKRLALAKRSILSFPDLRRSSHSSSGVSARCAYRPTNSAGTLAAAVGAFGRGVAGWAVGIGLGTACGTNSRLVLYG